MGNGKLRGNLIDLINEDMSESDKVDITIILADNFKKNDSTDLLINGCEDVWDDIKVAIGNCTKEQILNISKLDFVRFIEIPGNRKLY